jgi:rhamnogalacturonan endolyase
MKFRQRFLFRWKTVLAVLKSVEHAMKQNLLFYVALLVLSGVLLSTAPVRANIPGGGTGTGANVTVVDNGDGSVTMANGVVSIHVIKSGASINQINYTYNNGTGTQTQNLLAGGKNGGTFYWEFGGWGGSSWAYSLVTNNGSYAEIDLKCDSATNGLVDIHFSILRGSPGFYATPTWSHRAQDAAMGTGEERDNIYIAPYFNWMSVNDQVQRECGINATYTGAFYSPQENSLCTSGPLQGTYDDKYKWSADFSAERVWGWSSVSDSAFGVTGKNVGIWHVISSWEFYNGGPLKPELNDAPMVNMINGGHYYFGNDSGFAAGEVWTRVSGPYFIYVNNVSSSLTDPVAASQALYADAKAQAAAEGTAWPYSWMNNANYALAAQRGTVTGQIVINDIYNPNASASNLWVGVEQQPAHTGNNVYDFQLWSKPYEFWTKTDANGNFVISNVVAGNNYTLYAFGPGASGMFMSKNQTGGNPGITYSLASPQFTVVVTGGTTNNLGTNIWTPARVGPTVFDIGYQTRKGDKFRHGDDYWVGDVGPSPSVPSPIWTKFMEFPYDFPSGLNYVVGQNRWSTDWNFIQSVYPGFSGGDTVSSSTVTFNLASTPASGSTASVLMGIASDDNSPIYVTVNGTLLSSGNCTGTPVTSPPTSGWFPNNDISDSNIREENHGGYSDERLTFAGSLLHSGNNTINFSFRQAGGSGFTHHFIYDYIRLELTGYVPPAPTSVAAYAGNNSVLLSWPAVAGATSYNILSSTTSGNSYVSITNGVTGPVCGSGPANATFVDSTAANGTTYYYVVQSVNPVNASANSPQSTSVTPSVGISAAVPATPTGLTVTSTNNAVTFTWNAVSGANFYTVYRGTVVNKLGYVPFNIILSDTTTSPTYTDASGTLGCTYSYFVTATSAAGTSSNSAAVTGKPVPPPPASAPGNFHLSDNITSSNQNVTVSWSAVSGAVGYILYRANSPTGPFTFPGNYLQSMAAGSYTDNGLATNKLYTYMVVAMNAGGVSTNSIIVSTPPAAPASLNATAGNNQVTLNWPASLGATNYTIKRGLTSGSETTTVGTTTNTTFVNLGLTAGTNYYYIVIASDSGGNSLNSREASAIPYGGSGPPATVWSGAVNGTWDTTTANWTISGVSTTYADGVAVQFDDTALSNTAVNVSATRTPLSMAVNDTDYNYLFAGSAIAGTGGLTKSGGGTLTLTAANTFSGSIVINNGTLIAATNVAPISGASGPLGACNSTSRNITINAPGVLDLKINNVMGQPGSGKNPTPSAVVINGGTLQVDKTTDLVGPITLNGGAMSANVSSANLNYGRYPYSYLSFQLGSNIVVTGTSPSFITNSQPDFTTGQDGLSLQNGAVPTVFNVADVTGDAGPDLTVSAAIGDVDYDYSVTTRLGGVLLKTGSGTLLLSGLNYYSGGTIISAGTVVAGTTDNQSLPAQGTFNGAAGAAGALGRPGTTVFLGDANTAASNASPALLIGGPFTVAHPIIVTNLATSGTCMIGGSTDDNAIFSGAITVNQPLTIDEAVNADTNTLTINGGITAGTSGLKTLTFAGPGNMQVTTAAIANGSGQLAVNVIGGALTLAVANSYTGDTVVTNGFLQVNGSIAAGSVVTVGVGGVLGGSGAISGPTTVRDGGTLSPGGALNSLSPLTFGSSLTLSPGSTSFFEISESPTINDMVKVAGTLAFGGTLIVTNISGLDVSVGDIFRLFNAGSYQGSFTNVQLPDLAVGEGWNTNALTTTGTISVVALTPPAIASVQIVNGQLVISGSGGPTNWNYCVLATTNLAQAQWVPVATNQFDGGGNFIFTNPIDSDSPQTFYMLRLQ